MSEFNLLFKALNIVEEDLKAEIIQCGVVQTVPKHSYIVEQDKYIKC